ncbi:glycerophosphodiester phosphodiesterase family protein [Paenibacillus sp. SI8]|uniref:glycerophosphodiester phosphodiesterase family protein n=1 Tax=unclassified Paenibacillus TaxID=185978 RepID=UPI003465CE43
MNMKATFKKFLGLVTITAIISGMFQPNAWLPEAHAENLARKSLEVNKTLTPPLIDGKLDETTWNLNQSLSVQVGNGPFKASNFGVMWDNQYLYIGIHGNNNNLLSNQTGNWWEQNDIEIAFDPGYHQSSPYQPDDMQIGLVYQPNTATPEFHFGNALNGHKGKDEKKILRAISTTSTGWEAEVAVPWDMLNFDPIVQKQLGMDVGMTDRYGATTAEQRWTYWSRYNTDNFFNDTSGFGTLKLVDSSPVSGSASPILLQDNFDGYTTGTLPPNWISDVNAGSPPFTVVKDTYGNGRLTFDGNASAKQSRITAPVQWDNYTIEADVRFDSFFNDRRWASIMFRAPAAGKTPYPQMAIKQNGTIEIAYRNPDGSWFTSPTPISATGSQLAVNKDYTMKVRVYDSNVKMYFKAKDAANFTLYGDKTLPATVLPEKGRVGFQGDQSKVSFDNLKITRITADRLDLTVPSKLEALSGSVSVTNSVYYSDGITEVPPANRVKLYSSDESIIKVSNNQLHPLKAGKASIKAVYANAEVVKEITVTPSLTGVKAVSLKGDEKGYAFSTVGTPLDLSALQFQAIFSDLSSGTVQGSDLTWTSNSPSIVFESGRLKALQRGVYTITGTKDSASVSMLVLAKQAGDTEYVLYEENFDSLTDGTLPTGWTRKEGTTASNAAVKSGAFEINALAAPDNPSRVILPSYLSVFGNYKIEADMTHLQANDAARWHSIMYRIQNRDYPYYQMAVRKDATAANGVEFAERTAANQWNVMNTVSYSEAIDPAKMYHYTVKANGNRVQEWIGDRLVVDTDQAGSYAKGDIGFQANGSKMKLDNIRITLQQDALPPIPDGHFVNVAEPDTRIAMAASVVTELRSAADLAKLDAPTLPSTLIVHVNNELKVTDPTGAAEISTLDALLGSIGGRIIPAFYVKDEVTVDQLIAYLKANSWEDADVISDQGELVKRARAAYPIIRGAVDFSGESHLTKEDLLDIRRKTAASLARIAILPQSLSTRENVAYLQQRMMTIWSNDESSPSDKQLAMHQLITSGVNGIVTDSPAVQWEALKTYNKNTTLIRKPFVIGHRGLPANSPENTIESNRLGLEAGAEFIENDMYLSKDGHIVILHDGELERTTNGKGNIENFTLEQLKKLNANKPYPDGFPDVKIPTLDEQIDLAREKGAMVMAEIKTATPEAVDAYVKLLKDQNAEALVDTMSFSTSQLKRMALLMPEMPLGLLTSGYADESNVNKSLRRTLKLLQDLNASFNTSYAGLGKNFMEAAKHRGIVISPWTLNDKNVFIQFMGLGAFGITTDYSNYASDWAASIQPEKMKYELFKEESQSLSSAVQSYKGTKTTIAPEIVLLDGQEAVEVNGSKIKGKKAGTYHALMRYTNAMDANNVYDIYTVPITIEVKNPVDDSDTNKGHSGSNVPNTPTQPSAVIEAAGGKVGAADLKNAFGTYSQVKVNFIGDKLELAASGLLEASNKKDQLLVINGDQATYSLPLAILNLEAAANQLGVNVDALSLRFTLQKLSGKEAAAAQRSVSAAGGTQVADVLNFEVEAVSDGKSLVIPFGSTYVSREIGLNKVVDSSKATGVQILPETNGIRFVPALFFTKDGKTTAELKRNGNSIYTVIENNKSFADMANHWAKADVELLANKLVVEGVSANRFDGDRHISRAEFASLLVRALSLDPGTAKTTFHDVDAGAWYAKDVATAASAGLISGYADGTFRPSDEIIREELAAMVIRAFAYVGIDTKISTAKQTEVLQMFKDSNRIVWARTEMAAAVSAGLMNGMTSDKLDSGGHTTRAQAAVVLKRFLSKAKFIN